MSSIPKHSPLCRLIVAITIASATATSGLSAAAPAPASPKRGSLPPNVKKHLKRLPEKALSLEVIIGKAMQSSDSFRATSATAIEIDAAHLESRIPLEWNLGLSGEYSDDQSEAIPGPFAADRTLSNGVGLSLNKYFRSGTQLSAGLQYRYVEQQVPGTFGSFIVPYYNTIGSLTVAQNVWKDFLGFGTRKGLLAGKKTTEATKFQFEEGIEVWMLGLTQQYYSAWMFQNAVRIAEEDVERQKELLKITGIKKRRGTSEPQDFYQVESAVWAAENALEEARQNLSNIWRILVVALKLPDSWRSIDPMKVPMKVDNPVDYAMSVCGKPKKISNAPKMYDAKTLKAQAEAEAAEASAVQAKYNLYPEVQIKGELSSNGTDTSSLGSTLGEAFGWQNPAWTVGLSIAVPLGFYSERAKLRRAIANQERTSATAQIAVDEFKIEWQNECRKLFRQVAARSRGRKSVGVLKKRLKIETQNFRLGRTPIDLFIRAGLDLGSSERTLFSVERDVRLTAWGIKRFKGKIKDYLVEVSKIAANIK